jgi:chromosome segregation ATPase
MTPEELAEARRKAGFVSNEEVLAKAKAEYELEEKAFVKGRLEQYRKMAKDLRDAVDSVEKGAAKWAKAKDPDAAFAKWNKGYAEDNKAFMKAYRELTEKESRGGEVQVKLGGFITSWEAFNGDLGGKIAENEKFGPTLEELRKALTALEADLDALEKDETIEADPPADDGGKKKKKKK